MQMILAESAMLALGAALLGTVFEWWSAPLVVRLISTPDNPARLVLPAHVRVLGFGVLLIAAVMLLWNGVGEVIGRDAGLCLIQVFADFEAVGVHPHVAHTQRSVGGKLAFDCEVPLCGLRITVMRIGGLLKLSTAKLQSCTRRGDLRKRKDRHVAVVVLPCIDCSLRVALIIVLELPQSGHSKDAKASADDRFIVLEGTVSDADTWIEDSAVAVQYRQYLLSLR